jgi:hypothetical protein
MRADDLAHACEILAAQGLCERDGLAARFEPIVAAATSDFLVAEARGGSSVSCCRPSTAFRIS